VFADSPKAKALIPTLVACVVIAASVAYVFHGAIGLYFAQDDFRDLATATGITPPNPTLMRFVSLRLLTGLLYPLFHDRAWAYHLVSLGLHTLNALLLLGLLSRRLPMPAALVGATYFAVHPALFTALYWISARGDILATTFALCTVALAQGRGRIRWLAVPAYALSLLSKESTVTLPLALLLIRRWSGAQSKERAAEPTQPRTETRRPGRVMWPRLDPLISCLFLSSAVYVAYLSRQGVGAAVSTDSLSGEPYALAFDGSLLRNLLTYVGWAVDVALLRPGLRYVDAQNPHLVPVALAAFAVAIAFAFVPGLRARGWLVGWLGFLVLLVPVLPLRHHTYHYYLYAPLTAAALCVAALVDWLPSVTWERAKPTGTPAREDGASEPSLRGETWGEIWVVACCAALILNGGRVVRDMEARPSPVFAGLRGDSVVDRALIAEKLVKGVRAANPTAGTTLTLLFRERLALRARIANGSGEKPPPDEEVYLERNVRVALLDGLAVRALVPAVTSVTFRIDRDRRDPPDRYVLYAPTGEVEVLTPSALDSLLATSWVSRW